MADPLLLITQVTSIIAAVLIAVSFVLTIICSLKLSGNLKKVNLILSAYLFFFLLAVISMSIHHQYNQYAELAEEGWYVFLNISLVLGIISDVIFIKFWNKLKIKKSRK